jgi:hypothetical protein
LTPSRTPEYIGREAGGVAEAGGIERVKQFVSKIL